MENAEIYLRVMASLDNFDVREADGFDDESQSGEDIKSDEALFGDGLGLDSIDALELGIALQKKYGLKFYTKTIIDESKGMKIPKMLGVIEGPVNKMMNAYTEEFAFMRHETKRSLRSK